MSYGKKIFLVDTENVQYKWMDQLSKTGKQDEIILFYTNHSEKNLESITLKELMANCSDIHLEKINCSSGEPNALDFQLSSWLGYRIRRAPKSTYIIISNDQGYDALCRFWIEKNIDIKRYGTKKELIKDSAIINSKKEFAHMRTLMKQKYWSEENFQIAYNAIISGNRANIKNAIRQITGEKDRKDGINEKMEKVWINYTNVLKKKENPQAKQN